MKAVRSRCIFKANNRRRRERRGDAESTWAHTVVPGRSSFFFRNRNYRFEFFTHDFQVEEEVSWKYATNNSYWPVTVERVGIGDRGILRILQFL